MDKKEPAPGRGRGGRSWEVDQTLRHWGTQAPSSTT